MKEENWKDVPGFTNVQASDLGNIRVRRFKSMDGSPYYRPLKAHNALTSVGSYKNVFIKFDGKSQTKLVHVLVAKAFLPDPPWRKGDWQVNHIDGNKHNNRADNLEWLTRSDNLKHAYKTGLRKDARKVKVTDTQTGKVTEYYSMAEFGRAFDVNKTKAATIVYGHLTSLWKERYKIELSGEYNVSKQSHVKAVGAKDYVTGKLLIADCYSDITTLTGVSPGTVGYCCREETTHLTAGYVFRHMKKGIVWPEYSVEEATLSREQYVNKPKSQPKRFGIVVKDYVKDTVTEYDSIKEAEKALNISKGTIGYLLNQENKNRPFKGMVFKYQDELDGWPEYSDEVIAVLPRVKKSEYPLCKVYDKQTDKETLYTSIAEFERMNGINKGCAVQGFKGPKQSYQNRFFYTSVSLI